MDLIINFSTCESQPVQSVFFKLLIPLRCIIIISFTSALHLFLFFNWLLFLPPPMSSLSLWVLVRGFFSMFEQVIPSFSCPVDSCQVPSSRCCCHAFLMYGQAIHFQPPQAPTPSVAPGPHFLSSLTTQCPQYSVGKNNHSCFVFFFFHQLFARCRTRITIKETFC